MTEPDDRRGAAGDPETIRVALLLFAQVAEVSGTRRVELELAPGARVAGIWDALAASAPRLAEALVPWRGRVAVARNERYARATDSLHDGDVLALIPPVSGG